MDRVRRRTLPYLFIFAFLSLRTLSNYGYGIWCSLCALANDDHDDDDDHHTPSHAHKRSRETQMWAEFFFVDASAGRLICVAPWLNVLLIDDLI